MLCFAIGGNYNCSFTNAYKAWTPLLKHYAPRTPIVLVGTKSDVRIDGSPKFITKAGGTRLKSKIGARSYVECSAKTRENLSKVFEEAVRATHLTNWEAFLNTL